MKFAGIIAEYDPFHNGHAWQLAQAKAAGCRARRRRHELFAGAARARCPSCPKLSAPGPRSPAGLTLCLPCLLPVPARGQRRSPGRAWRCCAAAGCDGLVFGAETPDAALLMEAAALLDSDAYRAALKAQLCGRRDGASPPRGRPQRLSLHPDGAGGRPPRQAQQQPRCRILPGHPQPCASDGGLSPAPARREPR